MRVESGALEHPRLLELALEATERTVEWVQSHTNWDLGDSRVFSIYMSRYRGQLLSLADAVQELFDPDGAFPAIVDVALHGAVDGKILVVLMPSGHPKV